MKKAIENFILVVSSNILTAFGALITTLAVISEFVILIIRAMYHPSSVYFDLMVFLGIPGTFILGLICIPLGLYVWRDKLEEPKIKETGITDFLVGVKLHAPRNLAIVNLH